MGDERPVKFFRNGRNQAVRIPRGFELPGTEGIMRREGSRLVIEVAPPKLSLAELLNAWAEEPQLNEDWEEPEDPAPEPVEL